MPYCKNTGDVHLWWQQGPVPCTAVTALGVILIILIIKLEMILQLISWI